MRRTEAVGLQRGTKAGDLVNPANGPLPSWGSPRARRPEGSLRGRGGAAQGGCRVRPTSDVYLVVGGVSPRPRRCRARSLPDTYASGVRRPEPAAPARFSGPTRPRAADIDPRSISAAVFCTSPIVFAAITPTTISYQPWTAAPSGSKPPTPNAIGHAARLQPRGRDFGPARPITLT